MTVDLDDELRRLFQDQRLDIPVKPGADHAVVTGARRVRRRRRALASAGSAFAVAALVAGGVALAGLGGPSSMSPAGPPPTVTKTVTVEQTAPSYASIGFGVLKLGMTEADAVATGFLTSSGVDDARGCPQYMTQGQPGLVGSVVVSPAAGVVQITLPSDAKTPMGIGAGSTVAEVKARYPAATEVYAGFVVRMSGTPSWNYRFDVSATADTGTVSLIRMQLTAPECFLRN
jgi:hypothetical protein